jgi:hypothetical protein
MAFARWFYAPTGRKVIAQGKAKRRPGIRCATIFASPERAEPAVRQSMRTCFALSGLWRIGASAYPGRWRTTQGGAALYPGLSHYAPLGRTIRLPIGVDCTLQAIQVVVCYSGWRLPDGLMPQRGGGNAGSLNEARSFYAPTGRRDRGFIQRSLMALCPNGAQGDSPGQSEAPPWDWRARNNLSPERAKLAARKKTRGLSPVFFKGCP